MALAKVTFSLATAGLLFTVWLRRHKSNRNERSRRPEQVEIPLEPFSSGSAKVQEVIFEEAGTGRKVYHLKFEPNAVYPGHLHGSEEFCFLVHGSITDNFSNKTAPCFFYNPKDSMHVGIKAGMRKVAWMSLTTVGLIVS